MKLWLMALLCGVPLLASDPAGFELWSARELKSKSAKLSAKVDGARFASEPLGQFGNHHAMLAHREGDGGAELHGTEADVFVVQSGTATLLVGGKIPDAKTTAPHEQRGAKIEGGVEKMLSPGDIVNIPAGVPHQLLLHGGAEFSYFVMKISAGQ